MEVPQPKSDTELGESIPADPLRDVHEQRVPPVRGIVPFQNNRGRPFPVIDLRRWIRLSRVLFKTEKIDLMVKGEVPSSFDEVLAYSVDADIGLGVNLSLRTDCSARPPDLAALKLRKLYDVFLCPGAWNAPHLQVWLDACGEAGLPIRMQVVPPFGDGFDVRSFADTVVSAGVKVVNISVADPLAVPKRSANAEESEARLKDMLALAVRLNDLGVEANLVGVPFCLVPENDRALVSNSQQFFRDHQQYMKEAHDFALKLYGRRPWVAGKILLLKLGRITSRGTMADLYLLAWLANEHPYAHAAVSLWRKVTRHIGILNRLPKALDQSEAAFEAKFKKQDKEREKRIGPLCAACGLRRICDRESPEFKRALNGLSLDPQPGELRVDPLFYAKAQRKHYDSVDAARRSWSESELELAREANCIVDGEPPDRDFGFTHYSAQNTFSMQLPGAVQWFSLSNTENVSTALAWLEAPFTVSIVFGGGIADYIGFSLGRLTKVLCPMEGYSHRLTLHVDREGRYVLLRDGRPVRPVAFQGRFGVPSLIPSVTPVRLSIWNIDRYIYTQNLLIWEGEAKAAQRQAKVTYSIVVVCMRFSRRLQAVLQCIAHQEGIDFDSIEVVVAYIPGLDATDDVIASMEQAHPQLRIVRAPFSERHNNAKGLLINQAIEMASGEWTILLDSDILLPPDLIARLQNAPENANFIAPDRRKMLTAETTAKVLLGEVKPWQDWQQLLDGPGEVRVQEGGNLPIGFFQCVRTEFAKEIKYEEYSHYQGADWDFIVKVYDKGGPGTWLKDVTALHLDHGGSQWYGARKHS